MLDSAAAHAFYHSDQMWSAGDTPQANASLAALSAQIAASSAMQVATWMQHLKNEVSRLQTRVDELEEWRKKTLDEMRRLRNDHQFLRGKLSSTTPASEMKVSDTQEPPVVEPAVIVEPATAPPCKDVEAIALPPGLEAVTKAPGSHPLQLDTMVRSLTAPAACEPRSGNDELLEAQPDGITISACEVDGLPCTRAEWRIGNISARWKNSRGRALVSPAFALPGKELGISDMKLMASPLAPDAEKAPRGRKGKDEFAKKVTEGLLEGCLQFKVPPKESSTPLVLKFYLTVGSTRKGPFECNFSESVVLGCNSFGTNWLKEVDIAGALAVGVDILDSSIQAACDSNTLVAE